MKTFKELIGQRIQEYRIRAGYQSQQALADAIGIDRSRVSEWERGVHEPKGELRARLLERLRATENEIFGIPGPPDPRPQTKKKLAELTIEEFTKLVTAIFQSQLSEHEMELISYFRSVDDVARNSITKLARRLSASNKLQSRRARGS